MADSIPLKCEVVVPDSSTSPYTSVSRWSNTEIFDHPALIVVPDSEDDVAAAINYAKTQGLRVIPAGGGHGSFVPIDSRTLYLDMKKFDEIAINVSAETVTLGGGVLTGQLIKACTDQGFYTTWVNSNAVGVVGSILGAGNPSTGGLHGMMIDNVLAFRLITADGKPREVGPSSTGDELALFNALCGAGHGLGVITSVTMRIYPLAGLRMTNDQVWTRRLIFPAAEVEAAAAAYTKLQPLPPAMVAVLVSARAPPNGPAPAGTPMLVLTVNYYGPAEEAEKAAAPLLDNDNELVKKAQVAMTVFTPIPKLNEALGPFDVHGGYKCLLSARVRTSPAEAIKNATQKWLDFTGEYKDASPTIIALGTINTEKQIAIGNTAEGQAKHYDSRDRGVFVSLIRWYTEESTTQAAAGFAKEVLAEFRKHQPSSDVPRTLANNLGFGTPLEDIYTEDRIKGLKELKKSLDPSGLFWSPYGEK